MQLSQHFETYAALPDHVADAILEEAGIDPDEALELFEGDEFAHVIDPDGVETTIELAPRT